MKVWRQRVKVHFEAETLEEEIWLTKLMETKAWVKRK